MPVSTEGNPTYIENLLRQLGFEHVRRKGGNRPGFTACCLFHGERNPSFSIGDTGLWKCWTCGEQGNLKQLVERLGHGMDWREALKMVGVQLRRSAEGPRVHKTANLPADFSAYSLPAEVPPVISRRLKWDTIRTFHLGQCSQKRLEDGNYNPNYGRCIIPIYYKGKAVGYHGRALDNERVPRYYNGVFDIKDFLFNYDGCKPRQELIVLEGAFNCMSMWEKGFPNTVATFGTQFLPPQLEKLASLQPTSITICFDRDKSKIKNGKEVGRSGQRATLKLGNMLDDLFKVQVMVLPFEKDPNDLPADILAECYRRRLPFSAIKDAK